MKLSQTLRNSLKTLEKGALRAEDVQNDITAYVTLQGNGLAVEIQGVWHITNAGRMVLMELPKSVGRIENGTTTEPLVLGDWKDRVHRRGALDFLKCQSRLSTNPVY